MAENVENKKPFRLNGGYKAAIILNAFLCVLGIAVLVFAGVYSANVAMSEDEFATVVVCGVALTLIGVASAVTGLFHFNISKTDRKHPASIALGVIASAILLLIGIGLLVFSCATRSAYILVQDHFVWFIVCGCLFTLLGIMSFGVSGWFVMRRKRISGDGDDGTGSTASP